MSNNSNENKYLVTLGDDSHLKYRYITKEELGNQSNWIREYDTPSLRESCQKENKLRRPLLGLCNSGTAQIILSADFDEIPEHKGINSGNYTTVKKFWDDFYQECVETYADVARIGRSYSGKVKVFFPVTLPEHIPDFNLHTKGKVEILNSILFKEHHWFDITYGGTSYAFLNINLVNILADIGSIYPTTVLYRDEVCLGSMDVPNNVVLPREVLAKPYTGCVVVSGNIDQIEKTKFDSIISNSNDTGINDQHLFLKLPGEKFPKIEGIPDLRAMKGGEELVRILLVAKNLLSQEGFGLPTNKLARECGVSIEQASRLIKVAVKLNLLKCNKSDYEWKISSRRYQAIQDLKSYLQGYFQRTQQGTLPLMILDGKWEATLMSSIQFFRSPDTFLEWTDTLQGINLKDRKKKASRIATRWNDLKIKFIVKSSN